VGFGIEDAIIISLMDTSNGPSTKNDRCQTKDGKSWFQIPVRHELQYNEESNSFPQQSQIITVDSVGKLVAVTTQ